MRRNIARAMRRAPAQRGPRWALGRGKHDSDGLYLRVTNFAVASPTMLQSSLRRAAADAPRAPAIPASPILSAAAPAPVPIREHLSGSVVVVLVASILIMHAALALFRQPPGVLTGHDDAVYLSLARSVTAWGYDDLFLLGQPAHQKYPPAYPALLAIWQGVAGTSHGAATALSTVLSVSTLALTYAAVRRVWSTTIALVTLAALALNPLLVLHAGRVATEIPFAFFTMGALLALAGPHPSRRMLAVAAIAAILAALTRTAGVALLLAILLHWVLERRWAAAGGLGVASMATVGSWLAWTAVAPARVDGSSYIADLAHVAPHASLTDFLFDRVVMRPIEYLGWELLPILPVPGIPGTPIENAAFAIVMTGGLLAGVVVLWRRWRVAALYLMGYAVLLVFWPWQQDRYLVPLLPLIVPGLLIGLFAIARTLRMPRPKVLGFVFAAVIIATGAWQNTRFADRYPGCDGDVVTPDLACLSPDQASFFRAIEYLRSHVPADAVVLSAKPATVYHYTGHRSVGRDAKVLDANDLLRQLRESRDSHVLLGSILADEPRVMAVQLQAICGALDATAAFPPRTYLFAVRRADAGPADGRACAAVSAYRVANAEFDYESAVAAW
ncbi:MAG: glycosyltransferase family 39 protein [Gemmatimonadaceae bacterium]